MNFNALAAVSDALRSWPEDVSYPERLEGASPVELADARSRLQQIGQAANELRRLVDRQLATDLDGGALRYGDSLIRVNGKGAPKIVDRELWWAMVSRGLDQSDNPTALLGALYSADNVQLTGLRMLADALELPEESIRATMLEWEAPTSPLSIMPVSKLKWAQHLKEGEVVVRSKRAD